MKAMLLTRIVSLEDTSEPLELADLPVPEPAAGEVRIRVAACGVCHAGVTLLDLNERVGVGWIHSSSGAVDENTSPEFKATGRDVNGGYAEFMTVPERYAYAIPELFDDTTAAPLLCAGAIGFRALRLTNISNGKRLGLTGFGGSAHLVLQLARHLYPDTEIYVFARDASVRQFALRLGAVWAGETQERAPRALDAIIDTTPAWRPVVEALANLKPGGRLVINAIRKQEGDKQALLDLSYHEHLWLEKEVKTVANITRRDIAEFLPIAARVPLAPRVEVYPLAQANRALLELKQGKVHGAKVLRIG